MISMSSVWDRTTEFLSDNIARVVPLALLAIFLPISLQANIAPVSQTAVGLLRVGLSIAGLLLSLVLVWGQLALIAMTLDPIAAPQAARRTALARLPAAIGVLIILSLILVALALPLVAILGAFGYDFAALSAGGRPPIPPGALLWATLWLLVAVPVGLWLFARVGVLLLPVVVAERRAIGAIGRSWAITRGLALRIVGVLFLYIVVSSVAVLAVRTVFGTVLRLLSDDGDQPVSLAGVVTAIAVGVIATAFTVLRAAFVGKLYLAARERAAAPPA